MSKLKMYGRPQDLRETSLRHQRAVRARSRYFASVVPPKQHAMMERTRQSLQDAIKANQTAQEAVQKQLETIARRKKENRRKSASLSRVPLICMLDDGTSSDRPWARRFFVDQAGSVPPPNEDLKLRLELEKNKCFIHQSPLWSKKEVASLYDIVSKIQQDGDSDVDFQQVATSLNGKLKSKRSAEEARVNYQPNRAPFTKQESLKLLKKFHNGEELSLPQRTKWQAFQAFHGAADNSKVPWTVDQDEVLFQTVAAAGLQQHLLFVASIGCPANESKSYYSTNHDISSES